MSNPNENIRGTVSHFKCAACPREVWREGGQFRFQKHVEQMHAGIMPAVTFDQRVPAWTKVGTKF